MRKTVKNHGIGGTKRKSLFLHDVNKLLKYQRNCTCINVIKFPQDVPKEATAATWDFLFSSTGWLLNHPSCIHRNVLMAVATSQNPSCIHRNVLMAVATSQNRLKSSYIFLATNPQVTAF